MFNKARHITWPCFLCYHQSDYRIMYSRKLIKFMVLVLSILLVNYLSAIIDEYVQDHVKHKFSPQVFTTIGMGIVLMIYYPLFTWLNTWTSSFSTTFIKFGKKIGGKIMGSLLAFVVALIVLYYFYGKFWFHKNMFVCIYHSIVN